MKPAESRPSLESLLRECAAAALEAESAKSLEVEVAIEEALPAIAGPWPSLRRLLREVCRVAVRSMPGGGTLSVRARLVSNGPVAPAVRLLIRDSGAGYDAEAIARIRREAPRPPRGGAERALALARDRAQALGGALHLVSARHCGTSVVIDLPAVASATSVAAPALPAPRGRVLSFPREAA